MIDEVCQKFRLVMQGYRTKSQFGNCNARIAKFYAGDVDADHRFAEATAERTDLLGAFQIGGNGQ